VPTITHLANALGFKTKGCRLLLQTRPQPLEITTSQNPLIRILVNLRIPCEMKTTLI